MLTAILVAVLYLFAFQAVLAASISYESYEKRSETPLEIETDVSLSIASKDSTIYFLRGVFGKAGASSYCGETWNGNEFYGGPYGGSEGWKKLPSVSISSSSAKTKLRVKFEPGTSGCKESGAYFFRVERYTQGGSGSFDEQKGIPMEIEIASPTRSQTATPKPTQPQKAPTSTPRILLSETPEYRAAPEPVATDSPVPDIPFTGDTSQNERIPIVDANAEALSVPSQKAKITPAGQTKSVSPITSLLLLSGISFSSCAAILTWITHKNSSKFDV